MPDTPPLVPPALRAAATLEPATYTVPQLAELAQCSERHLWRLIDRGKVPGVLKLGRVLCPSTKK